MSASTTYTPLRDDTSYRSLSYNERTFLHSCATGTAPGTSSVLRTDGRHPGESRPIRLSFGRAHNTAECTVQFGANTRVSSSVTCHLIPPPHIDRPNDGSITFAVDLSPMSSMGFEYVQPASTVSGGGSAGGMGQAQSEGQKLLTNRVLRILERTLLNGGAIDAEALCVQSGKWVWRLHIDVTVLDHGGNLVDACVLSAVAAMRHFRKPEVQITDDNDAGETSHSGGPQVLHSDEREPTPLPLHHTPLTITFALYADPTGASTTVSALVDPSHREELVMNGNTTFSFNKYGEMCSLDFAGGCELKPRQLITCANLGKKKCVELCNILEKSLAEADEKSIEERLTRLKLASGQGDIKDVPLPDLPENAPYVERTDYERDGDLMEIDQEGLADLGSSRASKAAAIAAAEEESYRIQALDYSLGHVAAKVKENNSSRVRGSRSSNKQGPIAGASLMDAMLKSAGRAASSTDGSNLPNVLGTEATSSSHTEAADLEIAQFVAAEKANIGKNQRDKMKDAGSEATRPLAIDSDEEEETMLLQSEFGTAAAATKQSQEKEPQKENTTKEKKVVVESNVSKMDLDDEDVDLSMAVKKKSRKKAKKSKSKK
mmetsp:Transcript_27244/g.40998  ORF Transcript_27244/g.40998 Transcript_27244/m.40998 type:complete len:603 (+) Transcript_27244:35-1843(+)